MEEQKPSETEEEKFEEMLQEEVGGEQPVAEKPTEQAPKPEEVLDAKSTIEAALFMSTSPLTVRALSKVAGVNSWKLVEEKLRELQQEYETRGSAIVISFEDGGYIMRLKPEYERKVSGLAKEAELSRGAIKTLAVIAKNDGMKQSKLVKMIGSSIYDHVKELVEKEFITAEKQGRTKVLKTTKKFKEYFSV